MQFTTNFRGNEIEVNYGLDRFGDVALENVELWRNDILIEPDSLTEDEWEEIRQECEADRMAEAIDRYDDGDYAYDHWKGRHNEESK